MSDHVDKASPSVPKRGRYRRLVIGVALAGVASAVGLAFGEWLASGDGEGYARSGVAAPLTTESVTASETLYPGGTGDLVLRIHNPNSFPVTLVSVTPNGDVTSDDAACNAAGHGVTFAGAGGLALVVGGQTSETFTLTGVLSMALTSANDCQGDLFTVPVALNGESGGTAQTWYPDADADGFGTLAGATQAQLAPAGYVADGTDCDDTNATVNPGATEINGNAIDDDCDGVIDEGGTAQTWYPDADADGFGTLAGATQAQLAPAGYVADGTDCDDTNATVNPGATEINGNGIDEDCDGIDG